MATLLVLVQCQAVTTGNGKFPRHVRTQIMRVRCGHQAQEACAGEWTGDQVPCKLEVLSCLHLKLVHLATCPPMGLKLPINEDLSFLEDKCPQLIGDHVMSKRPCTATVMSKLKSSPMFLDCKLYVQQETCAESGVFMGRWLPR